MDDTFAGDPSIDTSSMPEESGSSSNSNGGGSFSDEIFSTKIEGRSRLFYIDLKESSQGKFVKISEKSRGGRRSTIMFDQEELPAFLEAFEAIKGKL